jgi:hypothetical protein
MPETDASYDASNEPQRDVTKTERPAFPWQRFFLSLLFAVLGWFAFWMTIVLAIVMWVLVAVSREPHAEFKAFVTACARYVWQCLAYILLLRDEKPFPLGPLPRGDE